MKQETYNQIGKPAFNIHLLSEKLEEEKQFLKQMEEFQPQSEEQAEMKAKIIDQFKANIDSLKKELLAL